MPGGVREPLTDVHPIGAFVHRDAADVPERRHACHRPPFEIVDIEDRDLVSSQESGEAGGWVKRLASGREAG
ncbi:hypothetical protein EDM76_12595 [bacterium]|nr:MAG: hypothetical protein EDM76_12595 [bacterium]